MRSKNDGVNHFNYIFWKETEVDGIKTRSGSIGVIVKDWKRSCGYNVIIDAERILAETPGLSKIMVVANRFSQTAKDLAKKLNILIIPIVICVLILIIFVMLKILI